MKPLAQHHGQAQETAVGNQQVGPPAHHQYRDFGTGRGRNELGQLISPGYDDETGGTASYPIRSERRQRVIAAHHTGERRGR